MEDEQPGEVCSTGSISFYTLFVNLTRLDGCSIPELPGCPVIDTMSSGLEAITETSYELINTPESQVVPKDAYMAAKLVHSDSLHGRARLAERDTSVMSEAIL